MKKRSKEPKYIFRPYITKKDGSKVYARDYGLKASKAQIPEGTMRVLYPECGSVRLFF